MEEQSSLLLKEATVKARYPKLYLNVSTVAPRIRNCIQQLKVLGATEVLSEGITAIGKVSELCEGGEGCIDRSTIVAEGQSQDLNTIKESFGKSLGDDKLPDLMNTLIMKVQSGLAIQAAASLDRSKSLVEANQQHDSAATQFAQLSSSYLEHCEKDKEKLMTSLSEKWSYKSLYSEGEAAEQK